jgi:hypothetical protein
MRVLFIGTNYPHFVEEARLYDVSRNVPISALANLNWGDEIVCATYESANQYEPVYQKNPDGTKTELIGKQRKKNLGQANLLCSFTLRDIYVRSSGIAAELQRRLYLDGVVASWDHCTATLSDCTPVARGCGNYNIGERALVVAPVSRVYEELREITEELKNRVDKNGRPIGMKLNVMIGGKLKRVFEPGIFINPIKFSRGLLNVPDDVDFGQSYEEIHYTTDKPLEQDAWVIAVKKYGKIDYGRATAN